MLTLCRRELRSLFASPLAWSLIAIAQFSLAWVFLVQIEEYLQVQDRLMTLDNPPGLTDLIVLPLFDTAAVMLLLITPLLSMRLISEELRQKTFDYLLANPLPMYRLILEKYLALLIPLLLICLLALLMALTLLLGGALDPGRLAAASLGLWLTTCLFAALGLFLSTLTRQPAIAAINSYGILLFLWFISSGHQGDDSLFTWISPASHFRNLTSGLVETQDLSYFLLLTVSLLIASIKRLDLYRRIG